jgi:uroporphyrinogen decarboxylase
MQQVLDGLVRERDGARVPNILFTKGGGAWLEAIAASGCDAVGVDWTVHLGAARERVGARVALQGNLEPAVLLADARAVRGGVASVLSHYGHGGGHVFNLGHGVSRFTPPENVAVVVEAVHEISRQYH